MAHLGMIMNDELETFARSSSIPNDITGFEHHTLFCMSMPITTCKKCKKSEPKVGKLLSPNSGQHPTGQRRGNSMCGRNCGAQVACNASVLDYRFIKHLCVSSVLNNCTGMVPPLCGFAEPDRVPRFVEDSPIILELGWHIATRVFPHPEWPQDRRDAIWCYWAVLYCLGCNKGHTDGQSIILQRLNTLCKR